MKISHEIAKAILIIEWVFASEDLEAIKNMPAEELYALHFGIGIWIRNNLLHEKSSFYRCFKKEGITHPDDMSAIIIKELHTYLQK